MRTQLGHFIDIVYLMATVWTALFDVHAERAIPVLQAWLALLAYCAICLALLVRKVRAYEVIK
jgi:lipopolysaccharide export LptBFGC system permease protein LptF